MKQYPQIIRALTDTPLAIDRSKLENIVALLDMRMSGGVTPEALRTEMSAARRATRRQQSVRGVGVIPVYGSISHRVNLLHEASGGVAVQQIQQDFRDMMAEPSVT